MPVTVIRERRNGMIEELRTENAGMNARPAKPPDKAEAVSVIELSALLRKKQLFTAL